MRSIIGVWQFNSSKMTDVEGNELFDPLSKASGLIIYSDTNHIAVQLSIPKSDDSDGVSAFHTEYLAYYGTYEIIENDIVVHHVLSSNISDMIGKSFQRKFTFLSDNDISLKNTEPEQLAMNQPIYRELLWQRILPVSKKAF
jgi:hypothetical protein